MDIDSPSLPLVLDSPDFLFSGWVIPKTIYNSCEWLVKYHDHQIKIPINFERPDVVRHFNELGVAVGLVSGFNSVIALEKLTNISLLIDDLEHVVINVKPLSLDLRLLNRESLAWHELHEKGRIQQSIDCLNAENLTKNFTILSRSEFISAHKAEIIDVAMAVTLFDTLSDALWLKKYSISLFRDKHLYLDGFFSTEKLSAKFSVSVYDFNFVFFLNKSECYYLVQHCTNICIVFPRAFKIVSLSAVNSWSEQCLGHLPSLFRVLLDYCSSIDGSILTSDSGVFGGFNITQSRPYHYFYDYIYGLVSIADDLKIYDRDIKIFGVKGFDFFDVSLLDSFFKYESVSESELNSSNLCLFRFLIMPCIQYSSSDFDRGLLGLGSKLRQSANELTLSNIKLDFNSFGLKVWVGISNEKRSWVEQVDGYSKILNELSKSFTKICVFVDGRTFPLNPSNDDFGNKSREDLIFYELVERNLNIDFFNIIGMQPVEKIKIAQVIDFFICSYATDSIYPSAFCHKPGVVYISPSIDDQRQLHIHHNIIEVPSDKVKEVLPLDGNKKSWHETSISMDWQDVYACVLQLIDDYGIKR